jgi:hypothetical protein
MHSWRVQCTNCLNDFCQECLNKEHKIFDGKAGGNAPKPVCAYCFFTLCARTCKASCCRDLPVKELKGFLARKGVSSRTALEKQVGSSILMCCTARIFLSAKFYASDTKSV